MNNAEGEVFEVSAYLETLILNKKFAVTLAYVYKNMCVRACVFVRARARTCVNILSQIDATILGIELNLNNTKRVSS